MSDWAQTIADSLKESEISLITGVTDSSLSILINLLREDSNFSVIPASREEEAIGIAVGSYVFLSNQHLV